MVGTAGWSISRGEASLFPGEGSHLARYARLFNAVEINSSFYREHRPATYARWASAVGGDFQFSVKVPREITHRRRLTGARELLDAFIGGCRMLGSKLGPLLVQLPPGLVFNGPTAREFFGLMRGLWDGEVVCEPRHPSWFGREAEALLRDHRVARVAADPPRDPAAGQPAGWPGIAYYRLHGSPEIYVSSYGADALDRLAQELLSRAGAATVWCIFDNTARGAAVRNAAELLQRL